MPLKPPAVEWGHVLTQWWARRGSWGPSAQGHASLVSKNPLLSLSLQPLGLVAVVMVSFGFTLRMFSVLAPNPAA